MDKDLFENKKEKGFGSLVLLVILFLGIIFGVYLVNQKTYLSPKAAVSDPLESPFPSGSSLIGDINSDGEVGILDFAVLLSKWGGSDISCDLNKDGIVEIQDFAVLLSKWGNRNSGFSPTPIPSSQATPSPSPILDPTPNPSPTVKITYPLAQSVFGVGQTVRITYETKNVASCDLGYYKEIFTPGAFTKIATVDPNAAFYDWTVLIGDADPARRIQLGLNCVNSSGGTTKYQTSGGYIIISPGEIDLQLFIMNGNNQNPLPSAKISIKSTDGMEYFRGITDSQGKIRVVNSPIVIVPRAQYVDIFMDVPDPIKSSYCGLKWHVNLVNWTDMTAQNFTFNSNTVKTPTNCPSGYISVQ